MGVIRFLDSFSFLCPVVRRFHRAAQRDSPLLTPLPASRGTRKEAGEKREQEERFSLFLRLRSNSLTFRPPTSLSTSFFLLLNTKHSRARPPRRLRGLDLAAPESSRRGHPRPETLADDV